MIPGEILTKSDDLILNEDKALVRLTVANRGDSQSKLAATTSFL